MSAAGYLMAYRRRKQMVFEGITREMLSVLNNNLSLTARINREWRRKAGNGLQTITIRRPRQYVRVVEDCGLTGG